MSAMATHDSVGAIKEHSVDFFSQANLANVLVILFLNLEDLSELSHLLLQPSDLLLQLHLLIRVVKVLATADDL